MEFVPGGITLNDSPIMAHMLEEAGVDYLSVSAGGFEDYDKSFEISDDMFNGLVALAEKEGIEPEPEGIKISKDYIKLILKGLIARDLWDMSEFYEVVNKKDPGFIKAVQILQDSEQYLGKLEKN